RDGLVRDDESGSGEGRRVVSRERARELAAHDLGLAPGLPLRQLFADAQDRAEGTFDGAGELATDELVALREVAPTLGVADDDPGREPGRHGRRDLARERA